MKKKRLNLQRAAASSVTTTLFSNTTAKPTFQPAFIILSDAYKDSVQFQTSLWAETVPGEDPDTFTWKSQITATAVEGAEWPVGYDVPVIVEVSSNVEGTIIVTTFTIILDATLPSFIVQPAVIELSYPD